MTRVPDRWWEVPPLCVGPVGELLGPPAPVIHGGGEELVQQHAPGVGELQQREQQAKQHLVSAESEVSNMERIRRSDISMMWFLCLCGETDYNIKAAVSCPIYILIRGNEESEGMNGPAHHKLFLVIQIRQTTKRSWHIFVTVNTQEPELTSCDINFFWPKASFVTWWRRNNTV